MVSESHLGSAHLCFLPSLEPTWILPQPASPLPSRWWTGSISSLVTPQTQPLPTLVTSRSTPAKVPGISELLALSVQGAFLSPLGYPPGRSRETCAMLGRQWGSLSAPNLNNLLPCRAHSPSENSQDTIPFSVCFLEKRNSRYRFPAPAVCHVQLIHHLQLSQPTREDSVMSIVQMVKPGLRETRTSQLAELGCVSRCLFVGLNHPKPRSVHRKQGAVRLRGAQGLVVMSFCTLTFNSGLWFPL